MSKVIKKPLKSGNIFITDSNFNIIKFTEKQALARTKRFKRELEKKFINGYKFKSCTVVDRGDYFTQSIS